MGNATFRTEVNAGSFPAKIGYENPALFVGSCFANHIGEKMQDYKFKADLNPFGVIYNPVSVLNSLKILRDKKVFTEKDLYFYDRKWISFYHYTGFAHPDKEVCLEKINNRIQFSSDRFKEADFLFITLGTAQVYEWIETGEVVSNCHKIPASKFNPRLLDVDEIIKAYSVFLNELFVQKPDLRVIFTVSPVRHWKDGPVENQRSKAVLLLAVQALVEQFDRVSYFPAYEIMMDDLRDYRFYAEDMLHIGPMGVDYIWNKFFQALIKDEARPVMLEVEKIIKAANHRPFNAGSEEFRKFVTKTLSQINQLVQQYPFLDFSKEETLLQQWLNK